MLVHEGWSRAFPWLVQGTTTRGPDGRFDLGLFSGGSGEDQVRANWRELAEGAAFPAAVHARQVHGSKIHVASREILGQGDARPESPPRDTVSPRPLLLDPADGHVTEVPGVLLGVTTADCVPVFLVDPGRRVVGALHAGWRGVAARILEGALDTLHDAFGTASSDVHVHLGPAICGQCYEVGPEVFEALGQEVPSSNEPIDVRSILALRARAAGVARERISVSGHCTRCTDSNLFSHRAGHAQRQVGFIGIREAHAS
jgi:YfiH family protein